MEKGGIKKKLIIPSLIIPSAELRINDKVIAGALNEEIDFTVGASLISHGIINEKFESL
jgi:hypothetical protein